jgi:hypothetical protein
MDLLIGITVERQNGAGMMRTQLFLSDIQETDRTTLSLIGSVSSENSRAKIVCEEGRILLAFRTQLPAQLC